MASPAPTEASTLHELPAADGGSGHDVRVWGLTLAWHPDPRRVGERAVLLDFGDGAPLSRLEPLFAAPGSAARPLEDRRLSRQPLRLAPAAAGGFGVDRCGSPTSLRINGEELEQSRLLAAAELDKGITLLLGGVVVLVLHRLDPQLDPSLPHWGLIGDSAAMVAVRRAISRVADLEVPVLVRGATGTGKELVARAIHAASPKRAAPFVAVNMAALPIELATAELFGAERGAYTGADRKRAGYFTEADGGTLFLDEIGETPEAVQPLLLRALENGEIQPLGGGRRQVQVRLVTATDADLEQAIVERRFRAPLFHRLRGFEIKLPRLADRREDLGPLLVAFLAEELERAGEKNRLDPPCDYLPAALVERMLRSSWPGNVRELRAFVRQLVIGSRGQERVVNDPALLAALATEAPSPAASAASAESAGSAKAVAAGDGPPPTTGPRRPADIDEKELVAAMRAARFRPQEAADRLGIPRSSIYDLIARSRELRTAADLDRDTLAAAMAAQGGHVESAAAALEVSASALRRRLRQLGLV